jgi:hypothetical protein
MKSSASSAPPAESIAADPTMAAERDAPLVPLTVAHDGTFEPVDAATLNARKDGEFAVIREFAAPSLDPSDTGPRQDFRDTILWAPSVRTDPGGRATIGLATSDAITSFRVIAEGVAPGGLPGHGEAVFASRLPVSLAATLPVEVSTGDRIALPVTITNNTANAIDASLTAKVGGALAIAGDVARTIRVPARTARTVSYRVDVTGVDGEGGAGAIDLAVSSPNVTAGSDSLRRELRIVPPGFPQQRAFAGALTGTKSHSVTLPETMHPGTARAFLRIYPTPIATAEAGVESIVREPHGCFEQTSSANYPNVMVLRYLQEARVSNPEVEARATAMLDNGYRILSGYETPTGGFSLYGQGNGETYLTSYGLLQFHDMAKVYRGVDQAMLDRTIAWLKKSRANSPLHDIYTTYAMARAGSRDLGDRIARVVEHARSTKDPYVLALAANALLAADPSSADGKAVLGTLAKQQSSDGSFPGARESVTYSGGDALAIETTALAVLAMHRSRAAYDREIARAVAWIGTKRSPYGGFSSTQATVLALEAMIAGARVNRAQAGATLRVRIGDRDVAATTLDAGPEVGTDAGVIELSNLGHFLKPGANTIELRGPKGVQLDYSLGVSWYDAAPATSPSAQIAVATRLASNRVRAGRPVRLTATITNRGDRDQPQTLARIGVPGGLKVQPWQLDELVERGTVDFVETREREVILYLRGMKPNEQRRVPIELLAHVQGRYVAPPSSSYLYYTDEHRHYAAPLAVDVLRAVPKKKKKPPQAAPAAPIGGAK